MGSTPAAVRSEEALFAEAGLRRESGTLFLEDVPLDRVAAAVGTPTFVYNAGAIRRRYQALVECLGDLPHRIHYAVKANSNLAVLRFLRDLGAGADLVSGGELRRALVTGFDPGSLVFSGVGKTPAELAAAIAADIGHVAVESQGELERLGELAGQSGRNVRVGIRVNPDVTTDTHPYISTSHRGIKFGIPVDQVLAAGEFIRHHPRLELTTIAMHLGSQLADPSPYAEGISRLLDLLGRLREAGTAGITALDLGGGLGINYGDGDGMDLAEFGAVVREHVGGTGLTIFLEPGRYLVGSAGVLLATVLYRKHSGGKEFVVTDTGLNDLLRPSLYRAHHEIVEVTAAGRPDEAVDVVGPVCESGDFLALERTLPGVVAGDRLAILGAGAYGFAMSSNYNSRPRAAEILVDGNRFAVARPREELDGLFRSENQTPLG